MHRLILASIAVGAVSCKAPERIPIKYTPIGTGAPVVDNDGSKNGPAVASSTNAGNACIFDKCTDLDGALKGGACDADPPASYALQNRLGVKVTLSSPTVEGGGKIDVRVTFENLSKDQLPVYFYRDPGVKFPLLALNPSGKDIAYPDGAIPDSFSGSIARIVLTPKGTIQISVPFEALRFKWKKNGKERELIEAGELPKGEYDLRVRFPFAGNVGKVYAKYDIPVRVK